eukprot:gene4763-5390_t
MSSRALVIIFEMLVVFGYWETAATDFNLEVRGLEGMIQTPNYPQPYPRNISVTWTLIAHARISQLESAASQFSIHLNFTVFDVEKVKDCRYDYVQVRPSSNASWATQPKYCNFNRPPGILSSSSGWTQIRFVTDTDREFMEFQVTWAAILNVAESVDTCCNFEYSNSVSFEKLEEEVVDAGNTARQGLSSRAMQQARSLVPTQLHTRVQWQLASTSSGSKSLYVTARNHSSDMHTNTRRRSQIAISSSVSPIKPGNRVGKDPLAWNSPKFATVYLTLTFLFAIVSLLLGIVLCRKFREKRNRTINAASVRMGISTKPKENPIAIRNVYRNPCLMIDPYALFDSPDSDRKSQDTITETIVDC